jgi:hypothetical protein
MEKTEPSTFLFFVENSTPLGILPNSSCFVRPSLGFGTRCIGMSDRTPAILIRHLAWDDHFKSESQNASRKAFEGLRSMDEHEAWGTLYGSGSQWKFSNPIKINTHMSGSSFGSVNNLRVLDIVYGTKSWVWWAPDGKSLSNTTAMTSASIFLEEIQKVKP